MDDPILCRANAPTYQQGNTPAYHYSSRMSDSVVCLVWLVPCALLHGQVRSLLLLCVCSLWFSSSIIVLVSLGKTFANVDNGVLQCSISVAHAKCYKTWPCLSHRGGGGSECPYRSHVPLRRSCNDNRTTNAAQSAVEAILFAFPGGLFGSG